MIFDTKEHSELALSGIKAAAEVARGISAELQLIDGGLPEAFQKLPADERRQIVEELRAGLITWSNEIDPIVGRLKELLRRLQHELWFVNYRETIGKHLADEEDMPWTQAGRDQKEQAQQ